MYSIHSTAVDLDVEVPISLLALPCNLEEEVPAIIGHTIRPPGRVTSAVELVYLQRDISKADTVQCRICRVRRTAYGMLRVLRAVYNMQRSAGVANRLVLISIPGRQV